MIGYKSIEVKLHKLNSILEIGGSSTGFYRKVCDYILLKRYYFKLKCFWWLIFIYVFLDD